jgi:uncharacterized protein involved in outer membrane biogenesis
MTRARLAIAAAVLLVIVLTLWLAVRSVLGGDRIKVAIEAQASAALGRPVTIQAAVPRLYPRVGLELTGVAVGSEREVTIDHARLTTGLFAALRGRVEDGEITIERSQVDVRWALALLSALATPDPAAPGMAPSFTFTVESIGTLRFRDVTLLAGAHRLQADLDSSLSGDRLEVRRMNGRSEGSEFEASGEFTSIATRTGKFEVNAEKLDLDGLLAFLAAATPAGARQLSPDGRQSAPPAPRTPLQIDIAVRARQGRVLGAALTDLAANCLMRGGDAVLEDLRFNVFGGRYSGTAAFRSRESGRYEWRGTFENLDVPQLVAFAGAPGSLTGRLAGSVALTAAGADPRQAIRRANGTTRVVITDGRVAGLEIVRSVILAFGKPSGERPEGSGEAFSRLAATLAVNGPNLSTNDLEFASRDFDMSGRGTISLESRAIDFRTDVVLSRELSAQAGRDLYRLAREGDRIVLPARITGTVSSPSVFIDVEAALGRALRNRAQDELKSIFDRFRKRVIK